MCLFLFSFVCFYVVNCVLVLFLLFVFCSFSFVDCHYDFFLFYFLVCVFVAVVVFSAVFYHEDFCFYCVFT